MDPTTAECAKPFRESVARLTSIMWPRVIRYTRARVGRRPGTPGCPGGWAYADSIARTAHTAAVAAFVETDLDSDSVRTFMYSIVVRVVRAEVVDDRGLTDTMFGNVDPVAQEVMILRVIEGLTVVQTATVLHVPAGRVRLLQHSALRSLELRAG